MKRKEVKHVRGVVEKLLQKWQGGTVKKGSAIRQAWTAAMKEEAKGQAWPIDLKNGVLTVNVGNSAWLYTLTMEKKNIINRFNENYTGRKKAKTIRFRIGVTDY